MNGPEAGRPTPYGGGRNPSAGHHRTPSRLSHSPSTSFSDSTSSRPSAQSDPGYSTNRLVEALRSCFIGKQGPGDEDVPRVPRNVSVSSGGSAGSALARSTRGNLYGSSNKSTRAAPGEMVFSMADIVKATKNFSPSLKIGQGGFGTVYKGRLEDGTFVAVKRAKKSVYDRHVKVEFHSEVSTLASIEHLNLVRFLGYLEYKDERLVVLEYVPNGTLREHLDGTRGFPLDLATRLDIAIDIAHAITYLHMYADNPIIHRDIKSSNILLTENLRARVTDFGFARAGAFGDGVTHISTQVKGTAGYLDPEYLRTYQLTDKSDVYSFGALLVELVSGRRPIEPKREMTERITTKWAIKRFVEGRVMEVLDPNLPVSPATTLAMEKILELAGECLAPTRQRRPSMRTCGEILWGIRKDYRDLLEPSELSQFSHSQRSGS